MYKRAIMICWLGFWLFFSWTASHATAGEADIKGETIDLSLGEHLSYLMLPHGSGDPTTLITPEQSQRFFRSRQSILRFRDSDEELWLDIKLKNLDSVTREIIVSLDDHHLQNVDFYLRPNRKAPASEIKKTNRLNLSFPGAAFSLPAHEEIQLLIKIHTPSQRTFAVRAQDPATFYQSQYWHTITTGIVAGMLLLAAFTALTRFIRHRDATYLIAALLFCSLALYVFSSQGMPSLKPSNPTAIRIDLETVMLLVFAALELYFTRLFLGLQKTRQGLGLLLGIGSATLLLTAGLVLMGQSASMNQLFTVMAFLFLLLPFFTMLVRRDSLPFVGWLLFSNLTLVMTTLVFFAGWLIRLPFSSTFQNEMLWMLTLGALSLLPALAERQRMIRVLAHTQDKRIAIAEAEIRAKNEFLTQLSHEIRTPMNGILGMTELLEETSLSPTQIEYIRTIASSGNHLLNIIDDILDYSKIEAGKMSLEIAVFDLASMLNECLEMFKLRAEEKSLELISLIHDDVSPQAKGDPVRIRQVIANLISNAIKFTENGEVLITVSNDTSMSPRHVRFEVQDTGIGITKEKLKRLMSKQSIDEKTGAGLGLAIVQQLVRMMKGQMGATSQPGKGSTFWFSLPLEPVQENSTNAPFFTEKLKGLRMLVVDDNASCRLVIQQQASSWGMLVTTAVNGKQAMALLRSQANLDEPFDVVILDHDMPGMNGLELAAKLKEDPIINNNLLVLMLTGHGNAPTATAARNAGVRRIITKPVTGRTLKITLAEELGHLRKIESNSKTLNEQEWVQLSHLRVLVAEDHPLSQKVINGMMHRLDVKAKLVVNGVQAVEEARKGHYDLILMDCDMPEMDGFEATKRIRQWEAQNKRLPLPIIALTAHIMDEHKERSLASGMNAHLSKPVELNELRDTMMRWASSGRTAREKHR